MDFYETINSRHIVREFESTPVDDGTIKRIISAGMKAPTNDHMRDWNFIVIRDKNIILELIEKIPEKFTSEDVETIVNSPPPTLVTLAKRWGLRKKIGI